MSKDSPDQILSLAAGSDASIDAGLYGMGSQADVFDMSGLMQASTGLQSAAEELKKAAAYLQGKGALPTTTPLSQSEGSSYWSLQPLKELLGF
jgi:N-acyl-D-aspartate/D-glutamate deacylase